MIIKKYVVNDMKEALVRAKYELGKDAIIISQKTVRPGKWYNIFRKRMLEVTIALEDKIHEKNLKDKEDFNSILMERKKRETFQPEAKKAENEKIERIFGGNPKVKKRWEDYFHLNHLETDEITLPLIRDFIEKNYMDNAYTKEQNFGKINVLVGPTGVGKTTTIAKIASKALLEDDKKVGLITIDTYRIAAVEQLKKYAKILGIKCVTVSEPKEIRRKLATLKDCDFILVDTIGASPKDEDRIEDIKAYLNELPEDRHTYLAISMSSDVDTNNRIMKKYKELSYNAVILTKFDEVENYNNFWNMMENNVLPVQYFCHGQTVPEDIMESSLDNVLDFLWKELKYD
ncbi:MAG TPA: hypothetical protein DHM90_09815 [Clostridiaceae bacterium]|nr:hypothetical protein [Clostridiaceae bacterium]